MKKKILSLMLVSMFLVGITPSIYANDYSPIEYELAQEIGLPDKFILIKSSQRDWSSRFSEGLCAFDTNTRNYSENLTGYTDASGNVVIEPRFSSASPFSEGLAFVYEKGSQKGGYIDITGKYILPPVFDYGAGFKDGKAIVSLNGYYTVINKRGEDLLSKQYSMIDFNDVLQKYICIYNGLTDILDENYEIEKTFEYSLGAAHSYEYWASDVYIWNDRIFVSFYEGYNKGILDYQAGEIIIPVADRQSVLFANGVFITNDNESRTTKIYDLDGNLKSSLGEYVSLEKGVLVFHDYLTGVAKVYDLDGNLKLSLENIIELQILSENMFFIMEYTGEMLGEDNFDDFNFKWYFYKDGSQQATNLYVTNQLSDDFFEILNIGVYSFDELNIEDIEEWGESLGKKPLYGVMDKNSNVIIPTEYDRIDIGQFGNDKTFIAQRDDTAFFFDKSGTLVNTLEGVSIISGYSTSSYFNAKYSDGRRGHIDARGNVCFMAHHTDVYLRGMDESGSVELSLNGESYVAIDKTKADLKIPQYEPMEPVKMTDTQSFTEDKTVFLRIDSFKKCVDGVFSLFDRDVFSIPIILDDRTLVPIRMLSECFNGVDVDWDWENHRVDIRYGTRNICFHVDSNVVNVSNFDFDKNEYVTKQIEMDVPARIINDRTYIPLRAVVEALGLDVYWDGDNRLIGVGTVSAAPSEEQTQSLIREFEKGVAGVDELKRMDASLATQPYLDYIAPRMLGVDIEDYIVSRMIGYTNTIPAYEALIAGDKDLILVTEPSAEIVELAAANGVEFEMIPFSKEGFVFLVNTQNPIDGLTQQQLRDIYQGKITNWSEVGGPDLPIIAYQRNASSGSQTIMENVFMKGLTMAEPLMTKVESMAGLIDVVSEFRADVNGGLGYSVYYYAREMHGTPNIKLLALDGIAPTSDSIRDSSYPVIVNYYAVKRKGDDSETTQRLLDFVMSDEGQSCVNESGLVSIK